MPDTPTKRQAVILIHGIGEQRPIVTLRDFVEPLAEYLHKDKNQAREDEAVFWDKPDPESGNYETRKLTMRGGRNHPTTDFYEFYWAHHLRNTNFSHIKDWLQRVVFRKPAGVSPRLKPVFYFIWLLIVAAAGLVVAMLFKHGIKGLTEKVTAISSGVLVTVLLAYFSHLLFNYLGDAARYLDPSPGNIEERQAIRSEGVNLLRKLHESGRYSRIVIVSHSLGSVIAYDLIKFMWNEYYKSFDGKKFSDILTSNDKSVLDDISASEEAGKKLVDGSGTLDDYFAAQGKSLGYLKAIGNKWLVTDLVTIGSPLAHAGYLFAQQDGLFEKLKNQREYPINPPHFQKPDITNIIKSGEFKVESVEHPLTIKYFNHSSPFAVTKWTNIFYSSDYVGGPMQGLFGKGINDIPIKRKNWLFMYPAGHTKYWDYANNGNILKEIWEVLEGGDK